MMNKTSYRFRDIMFEVMLAWGVDVANYGCFDGVCGGGRGCPRAEAAAIETFSDLWEWDT